MPVRVAVGLLAQRNELCVARARARGAAHRLHSSTRPHPLADLTQGGAEGGHWIEQYFPGGPAASYNIIIAGTDARGVDYAVEYDCSTGVFGDNYCLHFLSREPSGFDPVLLDTLVQKTTVSMGLNPQNRPLNHTLQEGCW